MKIQVAAIIVRCVKKGSAPLLIDRPRRGKKVKKKKKKGPVVLVVRSSGVMALSGPVITPRDWLVLAVT